MAQPVYDLRGGEHRRSPLRAPLPGYPAYLAVKLRLLLSLRIELKNDPWGRRVDPIALTGHLRDAVRRSTCSSCDGPALGL